MADDSSSAIHSDDKWHVFTLMATKPSDMETKSNVSTSGKSPTASQRLDLDETQLGEDTDEIDKYLSSVNKRQGECLAYVNCPKLSYEDVKAYYRTVQGNPDDRHHIFKSAKNILSFFYPLSFQHVVTSKFWGAIDPILRGNETTKFSSQLQSAIRNLHILSHIIADLKEELFSKRNPEHNQTNVPHEFIQAWMLILMYFILCSTSEAVRSSSYPRRAKALLKQGKMKTIRRLQTVSLRDREAASPLGIVSLLIGQLLQDARAGPMFFDRNRLASLYWAELQQLVSCPP